MSRPQARCRSLPRCYRTRSLCHIHHAPFPGEYTTFAPMCSVRENKCAGHERRGGGEHGVAVTPGRQTLAPPFSSSLCSPSENRPNAHQESSLETEHLLVKRTVTRSYPGTCANCDNLASVIFLNVVIDVTVQVIRHVHHQNVLCTWRVQKAKS